VSNSDVTVALATLGSRPDFLREAVKSITDQAGLRVECIIVADGVDRRTFDKIVEACNGLEVRSIWSRKRRGLARALNIAIRIAKSPYIARMDDDDICLPGRLIAQLEYMRRNDLDVCGTDALAIDMHGLRTGAYLKSNRFLRDLSAYDAAFGPLFLHPTVMMRTCWARTNKYDRSWGRGQDRELWVRTYRSSRFGVVEEPFLLYRRPNSVKRAQLDNVAAALRIMTKHWQRFGPLLPMLMVLNVFRYFYYLGRLCSTRN
jgi:glycosyltransferase involved in cell wall biosynthesis